MYRLAHGLEDRHRAASTKPALERLIDMRQERAGNDYSLNKALRRQLRVPPHTLERNPHTQTHPTYRASTRASQRTNPCHQVSAPYRVTIVRYKP